MNANQATMRNLSELAVVGDVRGMLETLRLLKDQAQFILDNTAVFHANVRIAVESIFDEGCVNAVDAPPGNVSETFLATDAQLERLVEVIKGSQIYETFRDITISSELASRFEGDSDLLQARFCALVARAIRTYVPTRRGRHVREFCKTDLTYPVDFGIKPIAEQIEILAEAMDFDPHRALMRAAALCTGKPDDGEHWFAIINPNAYAEDASLEYLASDALSGLVGTYLNLDNLYGEKSEVRRTHDALRAIGAEQESNILIIPAQFGAAHAGRSTGCAEDHFADNEFALDILSVISILITHPDRLTKGPRDEDVLGILCGGSLIANHQDTERSEHGVERVDEKRHLLAEAGKLADYDAEVAEHSGIFATYDRIMCLEEGWGRNVEPKTFYAANYGVPTGFIVERKF